MTRTSPAPNSVEQRLTALIRAGTVETGRGPAPTGPFEPFRVSAFDAREEALQKLRAAAGMKPSTHLL